jgi:membrane protease YdiL (CAAX protease family)
MATGEIRLRAVVLAALGYIAIMAVGMFTAGHLFGLKYGDPELVRVLVFFELALSLFAITMARRLLGHWHCGFGPIDWRGMIWLAPNFAVMAWLWVLAFQTGEPVLTGLIPIIVVTMLMVGFSEELMFRGVVLQGALRTLGRNRAILVSAGLFSLLHSVNVLAFVPLEGMVQQLALTFVFGLALACFAIRVNSLVPLMMFHMLWDLVQFLGTVYGSDFGVALLVAIAGNAATGAALWLSVIRKGTAVR